MVRRGLVGLGFDGFWIWLLFWFSTLVCGFGVSVPVLFGLLGLWWLLCVFGIIRVL